MIDGHRPTVAVVDDDEAVRDSLRFLLETAGFDVDTFASACQFLEASVPRDGVCLLVDQHMPRLTGLDLLQRLKERGMDVPVALMTGSPSPELTQRAQELGVAAVLEKPLMEDQLLRFVGRASG
ncbi:MAG: response regulator transcription factor [Acetobacteraceae bacterium]